MGARAGDAEFEIQAGQELLIGLLPDSHGPVALDIGVPADRAGAGAALAEVALQEQQVDDLAERIDRMGLLGQAQCPADGCGFGARQHLGCIPDLALGKSCGPLCQFPVQGAAGFPIRRKTLRLLGNEGMVDDGSRVFFLGLQEQVPQRLEQGEVSAHLDLQEARPRWWMPAPSTPLTACGSRKFINPASGSGLIAMTRPPLSGSH